jgi:hypothetical protein
MILNEGPKGLLNFRLVYLDSFTRFYNNKPLVWGHMNCFLLFPSKLPIQIRGRLEIYGVCIVSCNCHIHISHWLELCSTYVEPDFCKRVRDSLQLSIILLQGPFTISFIDFSFKLKKGGRKRTFVLSPLIQKIIAYSLFKYKIASEWSNVVYLSLATGRIVGIRILTGEIFSRIIPINTRVTANRHIYIYILW